MKRDWKIEGFDWLTEHVNKIPLMKDAKFTELLMPNGTIERWWVLDGETLKITYKKDKE